MINLVPDESVLESWQHVAVGAVRAAAQHAREKIMLGRVRVTAKGVLGDLVTNIDYECQEIVSAFLGSTGLAVDPEEVGQLDPEHRNTRWIVDPLDGTHNIAVGIPVAGVTAALEYESAIVVAAVANVFSGSVVSARLNTSATLTFRDASGREVTEVARVSDARRSRPNISLLRGKDVSPDDPVWRSIQRRAEERSHRIYQWWAPSIDLFLLLEGGADAIVAYRCSGHEMPALVFLAHALGLRVSAIGPPTSTWGLAEKFVIGNQRFDPATLAFEA